MLQKLPGVVVVPVGPSSIVRVRIRAPFAAWVRKLHHGQFTMVRFSHHPSAMSSETRDTMARRRARVTPQDDCRLVLQARTGSLPRNLPTAKAVTTPYLATPATSVNSI